MGSRITSEVKSKLTEYINSLNEETLDWVLNKIYNPVMVDIRTVFYKSERLLEYSKKSNCIRGSLIPFLSEKQSPKKRDSTPDKNLAVVIKRKLPSNAESGNGEPEISIGLEDIEWFLPDSYDREDTTGKFTIVLSMLMGVNWGLIGVKFISDWLVLTHAFVLGVITDDFFREVISAEEYTKFVYIKTQYKESQMSMLKHAGVDYRKTKDPILSIESRIYSEVMQEVSEGQRGIPYECSEEGLSVDELQTEVAVEGLQEELTDQSIELQWIQELHQNLSASEVEMAVMIQRISRIVGLAKSNSPLAQEILEDEIILIKEKTQSCVFNRNFRVSNDVTFFKFGSIDEQKHKKNFNAVVASRQSGMNYYDKFGYPFGFRPSILIDQSNLVSDQMKLQEGIGFTNEYLTTVKGFKEQTGISVHFMLNSDIDICLLKEAIDLASGSMSSLGGTSSKQSLAGKLRGLQGLQDELQDELQDGSEDKDRTATRNSRKSRRPKQEATKEQNWSQQDRQEYVLNGMLHPEFNDFSRDTLRNLADATFTEKIEYQFGDLRSSRNAVYESANAVTGDSNEFYKNLVENVVHKTNRVQEVGNLLCKYQGFYKHILTGLKYFPSLEGFIKLLDIVIASGGNVNLKMELLIDCQRVLSLRDMSSEDRLDFVKDADIAVEDYLAKIDRFPSGVVVELLPYNTGFPIKLLDLLLLSINLLKARLITKYHTMYELNAIEYSEEYSSSAGDVLSSAGDGLGSAGDTVQRGSSSAENTVQDRLYLEMYTYINSYFAKYNKMPSDYNSILNRSTNELNVISEFEIRKFLISYNIDENEIKFTDTLQKSELLALNTLLYKNQEILSDSVVSELIHNYSKSFIELISNFKFSRKISQYEMDVLQECKNENGEIPSEMIRAAFNGSITFHALEVLSNERKEFQLPKSDMFWSIFNVIEENTYHGRYWSESFKGLPEFAKEYNKVFLGREEEVNVAIQKFSNWKNNELPAIRMLEATGECPEWIHQGLNNLINSYINWRKDNNSGTYLAMRYNSEGNSMFMKEVESFKRVIDEETHTDFAKILGENSDVFDELYLELLDEIALILFGAKSELTETISMKLKTAINTEVFCDLVKNVIRNARNFLDAIDEINSKKMNEDRVKRVEEEEAKKALAREMKGVGVQDGVMQRGAKTVQGMTVARHRAPASVINDQVCTPKIRTAASFLEDLDEEEFQQARELSTRIRDIFDYTTMTEIQTKLRYIKDSARRLQEMKEQSKAGQS